MCVCVCLCLCVCVSVCVCVCGCVCVPSVFDYLTHFILYTFSFFFSFVTSSLSLSPLRFLIHSHPLSFTNSPFIILYLPLYFSFPPTLSLSLSLSLSFTYSPSYSLSSLLSLPPLSLSLSLSLSSLPRRLPTYYLQVKLFPRSWLLTFHLYIIFFFTPQSVDVYFD